MCQPSAALLSRCDGCLPPRSPCTTVYHFGPAMGPCQRSVWLLSTHRTEAVAASEGAEECDHCGATPTSFVPCFVSTCDPGLKASWGEQLATGDCAKVSFFVFRRPLHKTSQKRLLPCPIAHVLQVHGGRPGSSEPQPDPLDCAERPPPHVCVLDDPTLSPALFDVPPCRPGASLSEMLCVVHA